MSYVGQLRRCAVALGFVPKLFRSDLYSDTHVFDVSFSPADTRRMRLDEMFVVLSHHVQKGARRSGTGHYRILCRDGFWFVKGKFIDDASDLLKRP